MCLFLETRGSVSKKRDINILTTHGSIRALTHITGTVTMLWNLSTGTYLCGDGVVL